MKRSMQRRRPFRLGGKVYGTNCFESYCQRAKMIRDGGYMGAHSWPWIHHAEWRANMQLKMRMVNDRIPALHT